MYDYKLQVLYIYIYHQMWLYNIVYYYNLLYGRNVDKPSANWSTGAGCAKASAVGFDVPQWVVIVPEIMVCNLMINNQEGLWTLGMGRKPSDFPFWSKNEGCQWHSATRCLELFWYDKKRAGRAIWWVQMSPAIWCHRYRRLHPIFFRSKWHSLLFGPSWRLSTSFHHNQEYIQECMWLVSVWSWR